MLTEHFLRLSKGFSSVRVGEPEETTLADVADLLYCTGRNANLLLKKMAEQGWLIWKPGRGRGKRSSLTLLVHPERPVLQLCQELVGEGRVQEAMELLQEECVTAAGRERFWDWLHAQFGYQVERERGRQMDVLRFPFYRSLQTLDPYFVTQVTEDRIVGQIMDGLVTWDEERAVWIGQIALAWEADEAGTVWTFYLRKGVQFHNGREVTAEDVRQTFARLLGPEQNSPHRELFAPVRSVEAWGPYAVRFTLKEPFPLLVNLLGLTCAAIQPSERSEQDDTDRFPVGAGPFRIVRNDAQQLVLEAFSQYHRGRPFLDRVEMWVLPEHAERGRWDVDFDFRNLWWKSTPIS